MAANVIMPALGMAQETGRLLRWLKREGDSVTKGEPVMEVETDKATVEIEASASGVLTGISAQEGEDVPVGQVIALILAPGETAPASTVPDSAGTDAVRPTAPPTAISASPVAQRVAAEHGIDLAQVTPSGSRIGKADVLAYIDAQKTEVVQGDGAQRVILASPKARRLAAERSLALDAIPGTGPHGAVITADVLNYQPPAMPTPAPNGAALEMSSLWRVMVERLTHAWTTIPHFYLTREVDATRLIDWRESVKDRSAEKITYTDLLVKIAAEALKQHPRVNASWNGNGITANAEINMGLAVAVEAGLTVPVIHRADTLTLTEIAVRRKDIVERANASRLRPDDLQGGTFTISNLGMYGVDGFSAIVNPPQAAILAVGRIADRVVPVNGQVAIRPMMVLTLSFDHRVVDGARGAQFLDTLAALIEEPLALIP